MKPGASTNQLGLSLKDYGGLKSTLCTGCGHDSITKHIISAFYQSDIPPHKVAKVSGIGCSSKTPTYFMNQSHGFNSLHGRMAPLATGAKLANKDLLMIGVSGDGDSASIGLGGFAHLVRRNLPIVYIVANNGVYGLTKGQFSATADVDSTIKSGEANPFPCIDLCSMAIDLGCGFVARSFSGDGRQLGPLIDAAIRHNGTAFIDIVSPCVTFANHDGSTKSFNYVKDHRVMLQELGFVQPEQEIEVDYEEGSCEEVSLADGSTLVLRKIDQTEYDVHHRENAIRRLHEARDKKEVLTGLLYLNQNYKSCVDLFNLTPKPLYQLNEGELRPSETALKEVLNEFR